MDTIQPRERFNALLAQKLIGEFEKRNLEGIYCARRAEVLPKVLELIPRESLVSCGGSATLHELGIQAALKKEGYRFLDPDDAQGGKAKEQSAHEALAADFYLMSANAIAVTGEIVNLDGIGNRVAALSFGPKNVLIIAGLNKVEPTLEAAILRAKTVAAPEILLAFKPDYPTYEALLAAAENAYSQMVITRSSIFKGRIKVILVGDSLGF